MTIKSFELSDALNYSLEGAVLADPSLCLISKDKVLFRQTDKGKIGIISGGGSGHEPTHTGYIGTGMLAAVVVGEIFASPSTKQILSAIKVLHANTSGLLLIVKNYTGDVLHFGLAAERARDLGIDCQMVVVGDDVSVGRSKGGGVGRRALAGTVLVHKITGAFAENFPQYGVKGAATIAKIVNDNLVTIGTSLNHCKVPGRDFETTLKRNQVELGMGIHNEPGVEVLEPIPGTAEIIERYMLPKLLDPEDKDRYFVEFDPSDEVVLLVNNLGGISNFMISAIAAKTHELLSRYFNIEPVRTIHGTFTTAFNGNGFSITLLNASRCSRQIMAEFTEVESVVSLLDAFTDAIGWQGVSQKRRQPPKIVKDILTMKENAPRAGKFDFEIFSKFVKAGAKQVVESEPEITHYDNLVGDGDCGHTLVAGVSSLVKGLDTVTQESLSQALAQLSTHVEDAMGGTSGGLYSILLSGFSKGLIKACKDENEEVSPEIIAEALETALEILYRYSGARPGDCTMIDALEPFVKTFSKTKDFDKAFKAADEGAKATARLEAKYGRASYVGHTKNIPDPGAVGLVEFLRGVKEGLKNYLVQKSITKLSLSG
ncbi:HGL259Cp [Eremothecium sinecaudum]|uniref:HGL259Cp n=1 Tax=Eremothecium sinecaudum TaxID=45286 RepID=A0A120K2N6_9SACH|nr:HGL259Cp [Eremothecium sinecaudum]AMD22081.1 HGL259Cp [Eremothecium sinecaudum]